MSDLIRLAKALDEVALDLFKRDVEDKQRGKLYSWNLRGNILVDFAKALREAEGTEVFGETTQSVQPTVPEVPCEFKLISNWWKLGLKCRMCGTLKSVKYIDKDGWAFCSICVLKNKQPTVPGPYWVKLPLTRSFVMELSKEDIERKYILLRLGDGGREIVPFEKIKFNGPLPEPEGWEG